MNNLPTDDQPSPPPAEILNPWWRIWVQPRQTIAYLAATDPKMHFWLLACFYGVVNASSIAITYSIGDQLSAPEVGMFILASGTISGILGIFFTASLLKLAGGLLGGVAESQHIRMVLVWAAIPLNVLTMLSLIPLIGMFGSDVFTSTNPRLQNMLFGQELAADIASMGIFLWRNALGLVGSLYYIIIVIIGIAEVERFNIWKSIGIFVIVFGGTMLILFLCLTLTVMTGM